VLVELPNELEHLLITIKCIHVVHLVCGELLVLGVWFEHDEVAVGKHGTQKRRWMVLQHGDARGKHAMTNLQVDQIGGV
jgi:hypothetical protein